MKTLMQSLSLVLAFGGVALASGEAVTKEVTGEAAIIDGNKQKAQEVAKDNALRSAVEQVAGTLISATTLTQNSQLISDQVLSHSAGYVSKWEPVGKPVEEAGVMKVTVRATVSTAQLDKDLMAVQALITKLGNRKLVILTQEQTIDLNSKIISSQVMSSVLTETFKADGWTIIDSNFAAGKMKLAAGVALGQVEAKEIGELSKADYILYGNVSYHEQAPGEMMKGMFPVTAEYDLALFATDSGSQLAKISGSFGRLDRDLGPGQSALLSYERTAFYMTRTRGKDIAGDVRAKVVEYLKNANQDGNRVVMNVEGLQEYAAIQSFKRVILDSVTGVKKVNPGNFGKGRAQFDITLVGSTDDLAERLGGKSFKGRKISVTGVSGNTVEVTLVK